MINLVETYNYDIGESLKSISNYIQQLSILNIDVTEFNNSLKELNQRYQGQLYRELNIYYINTIPVLTSS